MKLKIGIIILILCAMWGGFSAITARKPFKIDYWLMIAGIFSSLIFLI